MSNSEWSKMCKQEKLLKKMVQQQTYNSAAKEQVININGKPHTIGQLGDKKNRKRILKQERLNRTKKD